MREDQIIARRDAVKRIARRSGYDEHRAEDIAQEAALRLIANANLISQSPKQAFVDAVRDGGEGVYSRAGIATQPVYESAFEDYAGFVDGIGSANDLELSQIIRSELLDAVSCFEVLRPRSRAVMEMYAEGFTMDEISERFGFSESRVSQLIKLSRIKIKAEVISQGLSRQKQRKRKWQQSQSLSREIQDRSGVQRIVSFAVEAFRCKAVEGLVSFKVPKVPQALFTSF